MLTYSEFKEETKNSILSYLPSDFENMSVEIIVTNVAGRGKRDGLVVRRLGETESPVIWFDDIYEEYAQNQSFTQTMERIADMLQIGYEMMPELPDFLEIDKDDILNNITCKLVKTSACREILDDMPHREFEDLTLVYKYVCDSSKTSTSTVTIDNRFMRIYDIEENDLFDAAVKSPYSKAEVKSIQEVLFDYKPIDIKQAMWVISNESKAYGASAMVLHPSVLQELTEKMGTDIYILPSSIHEVIVVSSDFAPPEALAGIVKEINANEVLPQDRLSDEVYSYSKKNGFSLATRDGISIQDGQRRKRNPKTK